MSKFIPTYRGSAFQRSHLRLRGWRVNLLAAQKSDGVERVFGNAHRPLPQHKGLDSLPTADETVISDPHNTLQTRCLFKTMLGTSEFGECAPRESSIQHQQTFDRVPPYDYLEKGQPKSDDYTNL